MNSNATAVRTRSPKIVAPVTTPLRISDETLGRMTAVFKLLADPSRLKIVLALAQDGELHVSALCDMLGQSQPAVSHHLTLMRMVGVLDGEQVLPGGPLYHTGARADRPAHRAYYASD